MIRIYTSPSCSSCRKVKYWFASQNIPFIAVNIFGDSFSKADIWEMLVKSENGTEDIISPRSKIVQESNVDFDNMRISELVDFIYKNPSVLKRPIIIDDRRLQVGYNEDEISSFLPEGKRQAEMRCTRCGRCEHCLANPLPPKKKQKE